VRERQSFCSESGSGRHRLRRDCLNRRQMDVEDVLGNNLHSLTSPQLNLMMATTDPDFGILNLQSERELAVMQHGLKSRNYKIAKSQKYQRGYMLITLMLTFALVAIAMLAVLPDIGQQIRRDREEELCHRGTMYMRAIQRYYRKFGRYPTRLEELEGTNNVRFLRKRYKDPMSRDPQTGQERDFKILHVQDVMLGNGPSLGSQNTFVQKSQMGGGLQTPQSGLQNQSNSSGNSDNSDSSNTGNETASPNSSTSSTNSSLSAGGSGLSAQVFGGGPIVGVASSSKEKTIREINKKNHYNDWYFIYDSRALVIGLLVGPWSPEHSIIVGEGILQPAADQSQTAPGAAPQTSPTQQNLNGNPPNN
jgi:type II secretory pathway pseudopilin PulG